MKNKERLISDFYKSDGINFASYDNLRKLPNYIDGLKISQRKLLYTGFNKAFNDYHKTEPFCNICATQTAYVHGPQNLIGIVSLMAAQYVGSNNYSLFIGNDSGFGTRINPAYASGRYTKIKISDISKLLFNSADNNILEKQFFEGQYIEPKHLIPIFPVIFLNATEGLSTGFSSSILPRNPLEIIEYIKKKLAGVAKPRVQLLPWFKGHLGKVEKNAETNTIESFGIITRNNLTSYTISELPIGLEYKKYISILDKLSESNIIQDYSDKCDTKTDKILFEIKTTREFTKTHQSDRKLYETFKLVKSLPEVLTCITENNCVKEYSSIQDILDDFISIRLKYYNLRKKHILDVIQSNLEKLSSKWIFCEGIISKKILVANVKKADIVKQLEKIKDIRKIDDSYDYLLKIPIYQITKEEIEKLKKQIEDLKQEYIEVNSKTIETMWLDDLHELKKML